MIADGFFAVDSLVGVHVLVVDGDPPCRQLLSAILRYGGALVTTTASADEALGVMRVAKCDVLVVELELAPESGVDLIRRVRALAPDVSDGVRAIALSEGAANLHGARAAGFDASLTKPIAPWALCRLVATLALERHAGESS